MRSRTKGHGRTPVVFMFHANEPPNMTTHKSTLSTRTTPQSKHNIAHEKLRVNRVSNMDDEACYETSEDFLLNPSQSTQAREQVPNTCSLAPPC